MAGKKQKRQLRWSRERIRAELSRLDDITGLKGANVTVRLYEEREPLGLFTFIDPVRMTFGFSSPRFEDPKFTQAEALDVIRHEYAHNMEYALFGESTDHGPNWQKCCRKIGARPQTFYTSEWAELARGLEKRREMCYTILPSSFRERQEGGDSPCADPWRTRSAPRHWTRWWGRSIYWGRARCCAVSLRAAPR